MDKSKFFSKQSIPPVACILNPTLFPNQKDLICKKKISYLFPALSIEDFQNLEVDYFFFIIHQYTDFI